MRNIERRWIKRRLKGKSNHRTQRKSMHLYRLNGVYVVLSTFAYGYVLNPLKMYRGKDCWKISRINWKWSKTVLCKISPITPEKEFIDVFKKNTKPQKTVCLKEFNDPLNKKEKDLCHYTDLHWGAAHKNLNVKDWIPDHIAIVFHNLNGSNARLFLKVPGKSFNNDGIIVIISENKGKYTIFNVKINVNLGGMTNKDGK